METFLASGGLLEDLGINPRVLGTQVVIFIATFLILARLLFGRVLSHVTRREEEVLKAREAIERDRAEVARLAKDFEARIARIDKEAYEKMQAVLREAMAAAAADVALAHSQAQEDVRKGRDAITAEKREALIALQAEIERLTFAVAEKVLEARVDPAVHGPAVRKYVSERS